MIDGVFSVHSWPAFGTVICLGIIQVALTYCGGHLAIEGLPDRILLRRGRTYRRIFAALLSTFVVLTFVLAKLNDANQHRAELAVEQERSKQDALRAELEQTYRAVNDSRERLSALQQAVGAHPPGQERAAMLQTITRIQTSLDRSAASMGAFPRR